MLVLSYMKRSYRAAHRMRIRGPDAQLYLE